MADGWLPIWVPQSRWAEEIGSFREMVKAAARNPDDVAVRPNSYSAAVVTDDPESVYQRIRGTAAFYVARMGDFYYEQLSRAGMADEANRRPRRLEGGRRFRWRRGDAGRIRARHDVCGLGRGMHSTGSRRSRRLASPCSPVEVSERDPQKRAEIFRTLVG